ncbi:hypothetical protein [Lysinibacillus fusiformis]|uniref:hypothetical protein n=1 Tax=Lysinibacillus fusiformis TaxID=28031 RepID=UPI001EF528CD|nr:hypothetical protein [Lysinibacillus fusiformis]MCG7435530.1 hypothetical protein [Lysinibacillus fusiformis]
MKKSANMYFPVLEDLKKVNKLEVDLLDWWVGTRKKNTWNYLNPLQFSVDCGVSEETAFNLFAECTLQEDVKLFEVRTILRCPQCNKVITREIGKFNMENGFPNNCSECHELIDYEVFKDDIEIYFSLLISPTPTTDFKPMPLGGESKQVDALTFQSAQQISKKGALAKLLDF